MAAMAARPHAWRDRRWMLGALGGLAGAGILSWSLMYGTLGSASSSSGGLRTDVCSSSDYSFAKGCRKDDHTFSQRQVGRAYIVTQAPGRSGIDEYQIVRTTSGGGSTVVARTSIGTKATRYVLTLSTLWNAQDAKVKPGLYELVTVAGNTSDNYSLKITYSAPPRRASSSTTTSSTSTTSTTSTTTGSPTG